ncbi:cation:proton antiporter, partial [bacterium]|nr:cation:proton antiporter [bacterium]
MIDVFNNIIVFLGQHILFGIGILLFAGYFLGKLVNRFGLPSITGYIIAGLLLGKSVAGVIHDDMSVQLHSITEVALGLIAITIGAEFDLKRLRRTGSKILLMTLFEATFAFIAVSTVLSLIGLKFQYALLLGAIAAATAPAATVIIVRELRARGQFIDYLYGIVAFDDAICVILFSVIFAVITPMLASTNVQESAHLFSGISHAVIELFFSCLIGFIGAFLLHFFIRKKYKQNEVLILSIALIFLTTSIAILLNLSLLIANMVFGAVLVNLNNKNKRIFHIIEPVTPPLFALFFILAGTELNINVFSKGTVIMYGLAYLASRFIGKYAGIYISGTIAKIPRKIKLNLGFCLFPQAGVAIGLVLFVQTSPILASAPSEVRDVLVMIVNVVLFAIFINELIGP